ncbi:hypothetical protein HYDPIDRAFT_24249 [Hydnomerulius pinastri MD-312]|nr:hypothetical protein HYDPIDRAFT_24249 [Hydnomerulius pinastri MD-312]
MSNTPKSTQPTTRKRKSQNIEPETGAAKRPRKQLASPVSPCEAAIPSQAGRCVLMEMPLEILDKIFGPESDLQVADYIALAGSCRSFRVSFNQTFWQKLVALAEVPNHIFSQTANQRVTLKFKRSFPTPLFMQEGIDVVNARMITTTDARKVFKLPTKKLIDSLPFSKRPNPHHPRGAPMRLFNEAQVRRLAYLHHGGPGRLEVYVRKRLAAAEKSKATREKHRTSSKRTDSV